MQALMNALWFEPQQILSTMIGALANALIISPHRTPEWVEIPLRLAGCDALESR
jgi:hypothetical protein